MPPRTAGTPGQPAIPAESSSVTRGPGISPVLHIVLCDPYVEQGSTRSLQHNITLRVEPVSEPRCGPEFWMPAPPPLEFQQRRAHRQPLTGQPGLPRAAYQRS
jgi:hypothetical protein